MYDVSRFFGLDYIYFDLIFVVFFLVLLIYYKKYIALAAFAIGGFFINFLIDWGYWFHFGIREISIPSSFLPSLDRGTAVIIFMLWFSLTYGVEYAYVFLMFEKKPRFFYWTTVIFIGWLLVAFLSQYLSINDGAVELTRHMGHSRVLRLLLFAVGYGLLVFFKYDWKKIFYLFFVGFVIHFMMEFSLLISGIRPGSFWILIENSLIEFNMGVPFFYLLYDKVLRPRLK